MHTHRLELPRSQARLTAFRMRDERETLLVDPEPDAPPRGRRRRTAAHLQLVEGRAEPDTLACAVVALFLSDRADRPRLPAGERPLLQGFLAQLDAEGFTELPRRIFALAAHPLHGLPIPARRRGRLAFLDADTPRITPAFLDPGSCRTWDWRTERIGYAALRDELAATTLHDRALREALRAHYPADEYAAIRARQEAHLAGRAPLRPEPNAFTVALPAINAWIPEARLRYRLELEIGTREPLDWNQWRHRHNRVLVDIVDRLAGHFRAPYRVEENLAWFDERKDLERVIAALRAEGHAHGPVNVQEQLFRMRLGCLAGVAVR